MAAQRRLGFLPHSHSWSYSNCLSILGPYGIWHIARECMYDTLLQVTVPCVRVVLPRILSVCFRVSSAPHFTVFTWPEASTINCASILDVVRKCVGNLLYTFTAASLLVTQIVHHLSEIGSGEHDRILVRLQLIYAPNSPCSEAAGIDGKVWLPSLPIQCQVLWLRSAIFSQAPTSVIDCVCPNAEAVLVRPSHPRRRFPCVVPLGVKRGASMDFFP
jgi:hypothetical protein